MPDPRDDARRKAGRGKAGTQDTAAPATVVVTLKEEACSDVHKVRKKLEKAGLEVEQVLDFLGQIVGKGHPKDVEALRKVEGVQAVEESREVQLPPPGSLIQ